MMIGERNHHAPSVHVPPWTFADSPPSGVMSFPASPNGNGPNFNAVDDDNCSFFLQTDDFSALRRYLAKHHDGNDPDMDGSDLDPDMPLDAYSCDGFRMYEFKIRKCARGQSHDWTDCPFAHPGEKARRRDPRFYSYSGTPCPDFKKGNCKKGDGCEFAHGVFECWLHPSRYRTQPCKDGLNCRRRVCFFAHTTEQLRDLSPRSESYDGSPRRLTQNGSSVRGLSFVSSDYSSSPLSESPPMSPMATNSLSRSLGSASVGDDVVTSLRQLQLNRVKSFSPSRGLQMGSRFPTTRPGFCSLPSTPTVHAVPSLGLLDHWDEGCVEEEPVMERVESGRGLRARMFEKLSKENPLDRSDPNPPEEPSPDLGWVSELVT